MNGQVGGLPIPLFLSSNPSTKKSEIPYLINYNTCPRRDNFVHLLVGATDGHAIFTTSLRLDASFAMTPRALRPDLDRAKSASGFAVEIGKPAIADGFEVKPVKSSMSTRVRPPAEH